MFVEVEEGEQDQYEEAEIFFRFIADLPLGWYMGCVIEYFLAIRSLLGGNMVVAMLCQLLKLNSATSCQLSMRCYCESELHPFG